MELSRIERALQIAYTAHDGQVRKDDGTPYIIHPVVVAMKLQEHGFAEPVIAAAIVHDVVEDSDTTIAEVSNALGADVAEIVAAVSEDRSLQWEERKTQYIEMIKRSSEDVKAVSISDKIHNLESLLIAHKKQGAVLWSKFSRSRDAQLWFAEHLLDMFQESWRHPLVDEYAALVAQLRSCK